MINELLDTILISLIKIILIIGIGYIINFIKVKIGMETIAKYVHLTRTFVQSVEQEFGPGMGPDKKSEVMQLLQNAAKGKLPQDLMSKMIESAVFEMNQSHPLKEKKN